MKFAVEINFNSDQDETGNAFFDFFKNINSGTNPINKKEKFFNLCYLGDSQNYSKKYIGNDYFHCLSFLSQEDKEKLHSIVDTKYFENKTVSEVMLELYIKNGPDFLDNLDHGFCFILFDDSKKQVVSNRDFIGFQNIYYLKNRETVYLSSDFKFLSQLTGQKFSLNSKKMKDFLDLKDLCKSSTFFNEIKKVPPSYELIVNNENITTKKYTEIKEYGLNGNLDFSKKLLNKLSKSILTNDNFDQKDIGFLMSGGLDSSSIISIFKKIKKPDQNLFAYSAQFRKFNDKQIKLSDESDFQNEILCSEEIVDRSFDASNSSTISNLDFYLELIGQPFFFPNLYIPNEAFKKASKDGITVMLNGNDGDSVISHGFEYFIYLFLKLRWIELYKQISHTSKIRKKNKMFIFKRTVIDQLSFYGKTFKSPKKRHIEVLSTVIHANAIEVQSALAGFYGIRESYPFYNRTLIEFCINVPSKEKNKKGYSRHLLRDAMKGILPEKIRKRTSKANLGHALCFNFCAKDLNVIEYHLHNPQKKVAQLCNIEMLRKTWEKVKKEPQNFATRSNVPSKIFSYVVLNRWLELNNEFTDLL